MTSLPVPISGQSTAREALEKMREVQLRSLVVERRRNRDEYGIVVVRDIACRAGQLTGRHRQ